eukprot:543424-Pelagomonas_calceolata.AAC.2
MVMLAAEGDGTVLRVSVFRPSRALWLPLSAPAAFAEGEDGRDGSAGRGRAWLVMGWLLLLGSGMSGGRGAALSALLLA